MQNNPMDLLRPQLEAMQEMYKAGLKAGIAEGRRLAAAEFVEELKKIQEDSHAQATPTH